jgi:hypothetical protein
MKIWKKTIPRIFCTCWSQRPPPRRVLEETLSLHYCEIQKTTISNEVLWVDEHACCKRHGTSHRGTSIEGRPLLSWTNIRCISSTKSGNNDKSTTSGQTTLPLSIHLALTPIFAVDSDGCQRNDEKHISPDVMKSKETKSPIWRIDKNAMESTPRRRREGQLRCGMELRLNYSLRVALTTPTMYHRRQALTLKSQPEWRSEVPFSAAAVAASGGREETSPQAGGDPEVGEVVAFASCHKRQRGSEFRPFGRAARGICD